MLRLAIAFLLASTALAQAQQLTITQSGTLPLDGYGYHIFTPTIPVSPTGSCAAKTYNGTCIAKASTSSPGDCTAQPATNPIDNSDTHSCSTISAAFALLATHSNHPDWVLLKKGDTFQDMSLGTAGSATGTLFTSGKSPTEPFVMTAYPTNATGARPLVEPANNVALLSTGGGGGCTIGIPCGDNFAIVGIKGYAYTRDPNCGGTGSCFILNNPGALNLLQPFAGAIYIEDNDLSFFTTHVITPAATTPATGTLIVWRNVISNNYNTTGHSQGMLTSQIANQIIEDNVSDHNGGNASIVAADFNVFNHDWYLQVDSGPVVFQRNIISNDGGATQGRPGGLFNDNLFLLDAIGLGGGSSPSTVVNNVFTEGINLNNNPLQTNAATASGGVLTFASVPAAAAAGMGVVDTDTAGAIPSNSVVQSKTGTTITISPGVTGSGVLSGDHIVLFQPRGDGVAFLPETITTIQPNATTAAGGTVLNFTGTLPTAISGTGEGLTLVDTDNAGAIALATISGLGTQTGGTFNIALSKAVLAGANGMGVQAGDHLVFSVLSYGGVPLSTTGVNASPTNFTTNIVTNRNLTNPPDYGVEYQAGMTGGVAGGNIVCAWGTINMYIDQGSNTSSGNTFQASNCSGIGPDPANATIGSYASSVGLTATSAAFLTCAKGISRDNFVNGTFNPACMAHPADNFMRQKLGVLQN